MAQYINDPVPKYRQDDLNKTTKDLHGYVTGLSDQLQYLLANLDADNIPELPDLIKRITDAQGNITNLELTAKGLKLTVQDHENRLTKVTITVEGIETNVSDMKGNLSELKQTVDGIKTRVQDAEGNISGLTQTAKQIQTQVADNKGNISILQQTANSLKTQISDNKGNISSLQQTAQKIQTQVSDNKGSISTLQQTANSLSVRVSNNETGLSSLRITANGLESRVSDLNGKYSSLKQTVDGFDFTGMVTFRDLNHELQDYPTNRDLERGRTVIDGACISTGQIDADYIYMHGQMEVYDGRYAGGYIGYCNGYSNQGIGVMESRSGGQCICTDGGARLTHGASRNEIWVARSGCHSSESMQTYSDRRTKEDIRYNLDAYEEFYRALKPCSFLMRNRTTGRRHVGFIAQEMEEALGEGGLCSADFAAGCFDVNAIRHDGTEQTGLWSLRYSEFIALNTAMIQKLMKRVDELENQLEKWKGGKSDGI